MAEETQRTIKSKHTSLAANLTWGGLLTTLFFYAWPDFPKEFAPYVPVGIVGGLAWLGSSARDLAHEYEQEEAGGGKPLGPFARFLVGLLG